MSKSPNPVPPGFHRLTTSVTVDGAAAYIDFLKKAFNGVELSRALGPGGKLMHAEVRIGDSVLMFNDDFSAEFHLPPVAVGRSRFHIHMYVPDVDAVWQQAVAAGCTVAVPLTDQFWGDRYGHLTDPFGVLWALATHMEDLTPEEIGERQKQAFAGGHPS